MTERTNTTGTNANNTTSTNGIREDGCIVLRINVFKTKFAADAADTIDKMVAEKAEAVESGKELSEADKVTEITAIKPEITPFDDAVYFLKNNVSGEDFIELVSYAKAHHNKFLNCVKELTGAVNADDAYCSALIELARPLGEQVERRAFNLLNEAIENKDSIDKFVEFFEALKVING